MNRIWPALGLAAVVACVVFVYSVTGAFNMHAPSSAAAYDGPSGRLEQLSQLYSQESVRLCADMDVPPHYAASDVHLKIVPTHFGQLGPVRMFPAYENAGTVNGKPKYVQTTHRQRFCAQYTAPQVIGRWKAVDIRLMVRHQLVDRYPLMVSQPPPRP